jgi:hypothetical protein
MQKPVGHSQLHEDTHCMTRTASHLLVSSVPFPPWGAQRLVVAMLCHCCRICCSWLV